jgi:hypothetical protein
LAAGENAGWCPSLIISPALVEDGAPLLISNLNLKYLGAAEFFRLFPLASDCRSWRFKISTAVRMNAAFPYVSPATSLPTEPPRRAVDAGYLDNYGVSLACDWIYHNRSWLATNTSGVVLIQIRAYPLADYSEREGFFEALSAGMQWLTTPFETYTSGSRAAMIKRNDERIAVMKQSFRDHDPSLSFNSYVLQCPEPAALSWYMTHTDLERMRFSMTLEYYKVRTIAEVMDVMSSEKKFKLRKFFDEVTNSYYDNLMEILQQLNRSSATNR